MQKHMLSAAVAASLLCAGGMAFAQNAPMSSTQTTTTTTTVATTSGALSESAIKSHVATAGYKEVKDLKFKDGVWQAKARGGNDHWVSIKVGPTTGRVYQADAPSRLNENEIKAKLTTQGYQNIGHVKFDDGLWSADAKNARGKDVDLLVDPNDGSVVAIEQD
ncbi:MAG: PepSY domain-containing protein [Rhodanobacteraceae bacterium]